MSAGRVLAVGALLSLCACASTAPEPPVASPDAGRADAVTLMDAIATGPCPAGLVRCGGVCVALADDPSNCGLCGRACGLGAPCAAGRCACPAGATVCAGVCVDERADPLHCGACDRRCAPGERCIEGACGPAPCEARAYRCGSSCAATDTDPLHCGVCGRTCAPGQDCVLGQCVAGRCPAGFARCGPACFDTQSDPRACGACDHACGPEGTCERGRCVNVRCAPEETVCGGTCHDLRSDLQHCGACSTPCPSCDGASVRCAAGACELVLTCEPGRTRCAPAGDPCAASCVDTNANPEHCGACANRCGSTQSCRDGRCADVRCEAGFTRCGRACVALDSSHDNCGACGRACPAQASCRRSACVFPPCSGGTERCGDECVDTSRSAAHCGACGNACATGNCVAGRCAPPACEGDTVACGASCVDARFDPSNCGSCARACAPGRACVEGVCVPPSPPVRYRIAPSPRAWVPVCDRPGFVAHPIDPFHPYTPLEELPFEFAVYGARVRHAALDLNGIVYFGPPRTLFADVPPLPSADAPRAALYALGNRECALREPRACSLVEGAAPSRSWVVEYRFADTASPTNYPFDVELVLEERTYEVHLLYRQLAGGTLPGTHSTIALHDPTGTAAVVYAQNDPLALYDGLALRFVPVAE